MRAEAQRPRSMFLNQEGDKERRGWDQEGETAVCTCGQWRMNERTSEERGSQSEIHTVANGGFYKTGIVVIGRYLNICVNICVNIYDIYDIGENQGAIDATKLTSDGSLTV
jgi:hypothetical protein